MEVFERIVSAKTIEEAVSQGAAELGKDVSEVMYEVIEEPKKVRFFGMRPATDAKVRVYYTVEEEEIPEEVSEAEEAEEAAAEYDKDAEDTAEEEILDEEPGVAEKAAVEFLNSLIADLGVDAEAEIVKSVRVIPEGKSNPEKNVFLEINGEGLGTLIGRHGDVLDALQYLANIAAGRAQKNAGEKKEYVKICLDIEGYRVKREETLKALARRKAEQALNTHRSIALEPMLAYERRIIHSELQNYEGVYTYSVGSDNDRKVIIALGTPENPVTPVYTGRKPYGRYNGRK